MSGGAALASRPRPSVDRAIAATVAFLTLTTATALVSPRPFVRLDAPALDQMLDTVTATVSVAVAGLAWLRYRQDGGSMALFTLAAFLVLSVANGLMVGLEAAGLGGEAGMSLANPSQVPLYQFTVARILAAGLLVAGGMAALRGWRPSHPLAIVLGPVLAMLVATVGLYELRGMLPSLGSLGSAGMPLPTALGAAAQGAGAGLFLLAAALARRSYRRDGAIEDAYLSAGLVFAAFAQVHTALNPGTYSGVVTSAGLLRLAFDVLLVLGIQAQLLATLARLQQANVDLERLRHVEVERASLEERARLSREFHDGLAQDLWFAKLKLGRLTALLGGLRRLGDEARHLTEELGQAIDGGLTNVQQAVVALRLVDDPNASLDKLMARCLDDFSDRFGLRVDLDCDGSLPTLPPRSQAELLRITQEALSNVQRHADATVVRVRVTMEGQCLVVVVRDNGRGFDAAAAGAGAYGLSSMRERAGLIGGELAIESRPRDGTQVRVQVPVS